MVLGKLLFSNAWCFYEHVSRQSTVGTSKHRWGEGTFCYSKCISPYITCPAIVDFWSGRYTSVSPSLLSCVSFSSLLSFPLCTLTSHTTDTPQHSRANFRPLTRQSEGVSTAGRWERGSPTVFSASQAPGSRETPGNIHQDDSLTHVDFYLMHVKQIAIFKKEIFFLNSQLI